jgi:hypothetical protein
MQILSLFLNLVKISQILLVIVQYLLSSISKIFERVILKRLQNFITANNVLPNQKFGFRTAHSAAHQLRRVVKNVKDARNSIAREPAGLHYRQECYFCMSKRHSPQYGTRHYYTNFSNEAVISFLQG